MSHSSLSLSSSFFGLEENYSIHGKDGLLKLFVYSKWRFAVLFVPIQMTYNISIVLMQCMYSILLHAVVSECFNQTCASRNNFVCNWITWSDSIRLLIFQLKISSEWSIEHELFDEAKAALAVRRLIFTFRLLEITSIIFPYATLPRAATAVCKCRMSTGWFTGKDIGSD